MNFRQKTRKRFRKEDEDDSDDSKDSVLIQEGSLTRLYRYEED